MVPLRSEIHKPPSSVAMCAVLVLLAVAGAHGQAGSESPSALIRSLSKERPKGQPIVVDFSCGLISGPLWERRTASELVQFGRTAVPDLDRAFDSVESRGWESSLYENAQWLYFAYARILGPAAAPRLQRMMHKPKLAHALRSLDDALALSLGLTSYVSGAAGPSPYLACRREQPRDALDKLIESLEPRRPSRASKESWTRSPWGTRPRVSGSIVGNGAARDLALATRCRLRGRLSIRDTRPMVQARGNARTAQGRVPRPPLNGGQILARNTIYG